MTIPDAFKDAQDKGLFQSSKEEPELSRMTLYQASSYIALAKHPTVDYMRLLDYDAIDWREYFGIRRN